MMANYATPTCSGPPMQGDEIEGYLYILNAEFLGNSSLRKTLADLVTAAEARGYERAMQNYFTQNAYQVGVKDGFERCREEAAKVAENDLNDRWACATIAAAIRSLKP